jgi:DNA-directed RNA polymerase subunit RPC12/RpoP
MMNCMNCGQELPEEDFEMYPTGTRRHVCRHCHYELHTKKGYQRWKMRQRARALYSRE